jgi:hypothetical protein
MVETLLWKSATRFHDWKDGQFVAKLLGRAVNAGILERVDWFTTEAGGDRKTVRIDGEALPAELFGRVRKRARVGYLEAGGDRPAPWSLQLLLPPYAAEDKQVIGVGLVSLVFEGARFEDPAGSARLADTFKAVHTPDNTEYAGLHWYDRWERLNHTVYQQAVTYSPMFAGVVWANFFGRGHFEQFDRAPLAALPADDVTWIDERGLFLVMKLSLAEARSEPAEKRFALLTDIFRKARR